MTIPANIVAASAVFPMTTVATSQGQVPLRVVMLAIGGAESGWDAQSDGDCGLGGPSCGSCSGQSGGATSWGVWQIHNVHGSYLTRVSGQSTACGWRSWLFNPANNAKAALAIYHSQGLNAWTTWRTGAWVRYLPEARAAVAASGSTANSAPGPSATTPSFPLVRSVTQNPNVALAAVFLIGGLTIAGYEATEQRAKIREWFGRQLRHGTIRAKGEVSHAVD